MFDSIAHELFPIPFSILTSFGMWNSEKNSSKKLLLLQGIIRYFTITCIIFVILSCCYQTCLNIISNNFDMDSLFVINVGVTALPKQIFLSIYYKKLLNLVRRTLPLGQWHMHRNKEEERRYVLFRKMIK